MERSFRMGFVVTHAAVQCYSCNPCATTWTAGSASVIQTSNPNDFCRVSATPFSSFIILLFRIENCKRNTGSERFFTYMHSGKHRE